MAEFTVTHHALERAIDMGVDGDEIREAFTNPRFKGATGSDRQLRTRGRISLVVTHDSPPAIITVLWATVNAWQTDFDTTASRERDQTHVNRMRAAKKAQRRKTKGRGY